MQSLTFVLLLVEYTEQHATGFQCPPFACRLDQKRRVMSSVAIMKGLRLGVENGVNQRKKQFSSEVAVQSKIGVSQNPRQTAAAPGDAAENAPSCSHTHRRAHALASDIADQDSQAIGRQWNVIIKIAAQIQ